jgi:tRNA(adenine34) deaminase
MTSANDLYWMQHAIQLAAHAEQANEVPVGAVLVANDNRLIGEGANAVIGLCDPTAHAEIIALRSAGKMLQNYRLIDTTLYVTLEPCVMCVGALVHARIKRLVFGAYDLRAGAVVTQFDIVNKHILNHTFQFLGGVCEQECVAMLKNFFKKRR